MKSSEDKKSFVLYQSYWKHIQGLTDEELGRLFRAIFAHAAGTEEPELTGAASMAFSFIADQMDRDKEKYEEVCEKRRRGGEKGGRPSKPKGLEKNLKVIPETSRAFSKPDNDNENDTDDENDDENEVRAAAAALSTRKPSPSKKRTRFSNFPERVYNYAELERALIE